MRIALQVEYHGGPFCGWQSQPSGCAVQDVLELALAQIAGARVSTICAGRTDTGVHALMQVVHFDAPNERPLQAWVRGVNALLPDTIAVVAACAVPERFHARFDAVERTYRYLLVSSPVRPALYAAAVGWHHEAIELAPMREALAALPGEHDFSAFRSSECQARSPVRHMRSATVEQYGSLFTFEFRANGFLHHMIRNLIGSLLRIGRGRERPQWLGELLAGRDRTRAAPTFSPSGLYLYDIAYPPQWGLQLPGPRSPLPGRAPADGVRQQIGHAGAAAGAGEAATAVGTGGARQ
jgi:tRNA pseudouridine38-40 synthase